MGECVEKLACSCENNSTSDGLQVFQNEDGSFTGFCFPCSKYIPDPYGDSPTRPAERKVKKKSQKEIQEELDFISSIPDWKKGDIRHIRPSTFNEYGVKVMRSEEDGETPVALAFPYLIGDKVVRYKCRLLEPKQFWSVGTKDETDFFGWNEAIGAGGKTLFITEGEIDALSLYQALIDNSVGTKWSHLVPSVVSVPNGASSAPSFISKRANLIRSHFSNVVLVFDSDATGEEATRKTVQYYPAAQSASLPAKDPNQCLQEGRSKALCNAVLFRAAAPKNSRIVWGASLHEAGREPPKWGLSWPWEGMTKMTRGMRFGETYYIGAGVKMGKSEMVNTLGAHLITEHGLKIFMAKPEEANKKTYQLLCGKVAGKIFHDPEKEFDYDAYDAASEQIGDNVALLNLYQHVGWDTLRSDILSAISEGCRAVFIDPITNLTNGVPSSEANTVLQSISQELSAISLDNNILAFIFCHLKAPESGLSHERGGKVLSHQFSGSRAMMRSCNMMLGIEGNKDPDIEDHLQNVRRLVVLEDREFGVSGSVSLYWDKNTGLFNELKESP